MSGLDLAKKVGLESGFGTCKKTYDQINCPIQELEKILQGKISSGIFVAWQIQNIVWGKFDGEKLLQKENRQPNFDDWLECRIFNKDEEFHLKRSGDNFIGRYVRDEKGTDDFYVDSFARLWGEKKSAADGWVTLKDVPRKLSMEIPCEDGTKRFYGLLTRNYINSDAETGLSGYVDYRFVAIESAKDGD